MKHITIILLFVWKITYCTNGMDSSDSTYFKPEGLKSDTSFFNNLCHNIHISIKKQEFALTNRFFNDAFLIIEKNRYEKGVKALISIIDDEFTIRGNYGKSIEYLFRLKKVSEKFNDVQTASTILNSIGVLYWYEGDYKNALLFYHENINQMKKANQGYNMAATNNNIGLVYRKLGEYDKAIEYYNKSLRISIEQKDIATMADAYNNIGVIYQFQNHLFKALYYFEKSLELRKQIKDSVGISTSLGNIGAVFTVQNKFREAEACLIQSLNISKNLHDLEGIEEVSNSLSELYEKTGDHKNALSFYKSFVSARDSLNNEETKREALKKEMEFKFDQETQKAAIIAEAENRRQKIYTISSLIIVILISIFFFLLYKRFRLSQEQKSIIESKNKEILDSINYAKRIQQAMLKSEENETKRFPEHFILFKPKDIVSGDFYWALEKQDHLYITAADCTGHGVPGAFVTMLGVSFLNEINAHDKLMTPADMLNKLRERIIKELGQTGKPDENKDGMDISLASLNLKTNELQWAGANNPLFYFQNNEMKEIKADKQPIAFYPEMKVFTNHVIQLKKGDTFYLFTDGYADQFGGPSGKKFKYKQFKDLLSKTVNSPLSEQKQIINNAFENWKGELEQVDDVCIIGVQV